MIQCAMNRDTLHQYNAAIPYGRNVESCLDDSELYETMLQTPGVMILGRFGELMSLNLMAAYMVEQIIAGKASEEILKTMYRRYARTPETAGRIAADYFELVRQLEEKGYATVIR